MPNPSNKTLAMSKIYYDIQTWFVPFTDQKKSIKRYKQYKIKISINSNIKSSKKVTWTTYRPDEISLKSTKS